MFGRHITVRPTGERCLDFKRGKLDRRARPTLESTDRLSNGDNGKRLSVCDIRIHVFEIKKRQFKKVRSGQ